MLVKTSFVSFTNISGWMSSAESYYFDFLDCLVFSSTLLKRTVISVQ